MLPGWGLMGGGGGAGIKQFADFSSCLCQQLVKIDNLYKKV